MFRIGEFAQIAQVSARQLRFYDQLGLLRPEHIDRQTGYRYYAIRQLPRLNAILALKDLGLTPEQIAPRWSLHVRKVRHSQKFVHVRWMSGPGSTAVTPQTRP
jgi:DNA-binding transcriptional MerR regulator